MFVCLTLLTAAWSWSISSCTFCAASFDSNEESSDGIVLFQFDKGDDWGFEIGDAFHDWSFGWFCRDAFVSCQNCAPFSWTESTSIVALLPFSFLLDSSSRYLTCVPFRCRELTSTGLSGGKSYMVRGGSSFPSTSASYSEAVGISFWVRNIFSVESTFAAFVSRLGK